MEFPSSFRLPSLVAVASLCLFQAGSICGEDFQVPAIRGPWVTLAKSPDLGNLTGEKQQPVDFGLWQAADGTWQLWSCIRGAKIPGKTRLLYRWEGKDLTTPNWTPGGIALRAEPALGETEGGLQAPFVTKTPDGAFRMFYGDWAHICSASSVDGKTFTRDKFAEGRPALFDEGAESNARDPYVVRIGSLWHCYYTAHPQKKGAVYCRTSADLIAWSPAKIVAAGGQAGEGPSAAECPFVVELAPGHFYLFRTQSYGKAAQTSVYHSTNPLDFGKDTHGDALHFITHLPIAAPELVRQDGRWFVAALQPDLHGIQIAPLEWKSPAEIQPHLAARPSGKLLRIALYDDKGSMGQGIPKASEQLGTASDLEVTTLSAERIREGLAGYDVVVFTGGSGGQQANSIGLLGREQVQRFVEQGGGYVGICAGAYLACDGFSWSVHVLNAKTPSAKWERGAGIVKLEATAAGGPLLGLPASATDIRYHNGPLISPGHNPALPAYETLAFFRTELAEHGTPPSLMVNSPAMVKCDFGKGHVIVCSPHPEQTEGMEKWIENAVRAVAPAVKADR